MIPNAHLEGDLAEELLDLLREAEGRVINANVLLCLPPLLYYTPPLLSSTPPAPGACDAFARDSPPLPLRDAGQCRAAPRDALRAHASRFAAAGVLNNGASSPGRQLAFPSS